jgi:hypothetical protein
MVVPDPIAVVDLNLDALQVKSHVLSMAEVSEGEVFETYKP